jgi:hypothetical protein
VLSLALTSGLILTLCLAFEPIWETNDDVGMSMVAHGYGLASYGSPCLVFSNVLWGYLVRDIPAINGVLGYSVATMAVLLAVGWATLYFLLRLGAGYLSSFFVVILLIARPTLFPQFTINAGLLTAAAVIGWRVHARFGDLGSLLVSCTLAFCGYLVRSDMFLLVLVVALPLLPWRALRERRRMRMAFVSLGVSITAAAALDHGAYSGQEWQPFLELDPLRAAFTDYRAGEHLKQHPEIMAQYGYSRNDIDLIRSWFFVDPRMVDPKSLNGMLTELGPLSLQPGNATLGLASIKALASPKLLPLLLCCALLFVVMPRRWPVAIAWLLFLVTLFAMGMLGRPGVLRVYVPVISLLLVGPIMVSGVQWEGRWVVVFVLFTACVWNAWQLIPEASISSAAERQVQKDIKQLPAGLLFAWGRSFPYQLAFPVFANDPNARLVRLYSLGSDTLAPYAVATAEEKSGRGMIERLRSAEGVSVIAAQERIEMLHKYCQEHLDGTLSAIETFHTSSMTVRRIRCEPAPLPRM